MALPGFDGRAVLSAYLNGVELSERQRQADIDEALKRNQMKQQQEQFNESIALERAAQATTASHYKAMEGLQERTVGIAEDTYKQQYLDPAIPSQVYSGMPGYSDLQKQYPEGIPLAEATILDRILQTQGTIDYYRALAASKNKTQKPGLLSLWKAAMPVGEQQAIAGPPARPEYMQPEPDQGWFSNAWDFLMGSGKYENAKQSPDFLTQQFGGMFKGIVPEGTGDVGRVDTSLPQSVMSRTYYSPEEAQRLNTGIDALVSGLDDPDRAAESAWMMQMLGNPGLLRRLSDAGLQNPELANDPEFQSLLEAGLFMNNQLNAKNNDAIQLKMLDAQNKQRQAIDDALLKQVASGEKDMNWYFEQQKALEEIYKKMFQEGGEIAP